MNQTCHGSVAYTHFPDSLTFTATVMKENKSADPFCYKWSTYSIWTCGNKNRATAGDVDETAPGWQTIALAPDIRGEEAAKKKKKKLQSQIIDVNRFFFLWKIQNFEASKSLNNLGQLHCQPSSSHHDFISLTEPLLFPPRPPPPLALSHLYIRETKAG